MGATLVKKLTPPLIAVSAGDLAGNRLAFPCVSADGFDRRRSAGRICGLERTVAAVEIGDELGLALGVRIFRSDQLFHLLAPAGARLATEIAQEMQRAEDFRQPEQPGIERRLRCPRPDLPRRQRWPRRGQARDASALVVQAICRARGGSSDTIAHRQPRQVRRRRQQFERDLERSNPWSAVSPALVAVQKCRLFCIVGRQPARRSTSILPRRHATRSPARALPAKRGMCTIRSSRRRRPQRRSPPAVRGGPHLQAISPASTRPPGKA